MPALNLGHSVRAIVLDDRDRILLCWFALHSRVVWATPGGGIKPRETPHAALRRELHEEIGLVLDGTPPHVWHRRVVEPGYLSGYDGAIQDYFLVRTAAFQPNGALSRDQLAAENITDFRWWQLAEITNYRGPDLLGPRDLAGPLVAHLRGSARSYGRSSTSVASTGDGSQELSVITRASDH